MTRLNRKNFEDTNQEAIERLNQCTDDCSALPYITQSGGTNIVAKEVTIDNPDCLGHEEEIKYLRDIITSKDEEIKALKEVIRTLTQKDKPASK